MIKILLPNGEWNYDPEKPLGKPGGFGSVFGGYSDQYGAIAVKKLYISAEKAGHREIRIAKELMQRNLKQIIPFLDAGIDANSNGYFFVMPCAESSLQQELEKVGKFPEIATIDILRQISCGLMEIPDIVHRDLKPGNILYQDGKWKIADFGIARFIEESTSINTLRGFLSPQYAAPEQWMQDRVTEKTDVYSLGCIAFALIMGKPPFQGPTSEEFKAQHLHSEPPTLNCSASLRSLILIMLRKIPEARPNLERVKKRLDEIALSLNQPFQDTKIDSIAIAGAKAAEEEIKHEATENAVKQIQIRRKELAKFAMISFSKIIDALFDYIIKYAPTVKIYRQLNPYLWLGSARLMIENSFMDQPLGSGYFGASSWDVLLDAKITIIQQNPQYIWGANLFYADPDRRSQYRWYEVMFMDHPLSSKHRQFQPFSVGVIQYKDASIALGSKVIGVIQLAAKPQPIDDENLEEFSKRWAELLAKAFSGELAHPRLLPFS